MFILIPHPIRDTPRHPEHTPVILNLIQDLLPEVRTAGVNDEKQILNQVQDDGCVGIQDDGSVGIQDDECVGS